MALVFHQRHHPLFMRFTFKSEFLIKFDSLSLEIFFMRNAFISQRFFEGESFFAALVDDLEFIIGGFALGFLIWICRDGFKLLYGFVHVI
jgi:hypothetical protein